MDIVELSPDYDINQNTANHAARILMETISSWISLLAELHKSDFYVTTQSKELTKRERKRRNNSIEYVP